MAGSSAEFQQVVTGMRDLVRKGIDWLDDRTGLPSSLQHFLFEEIPASSGWPEVFGSVALFLFSIQALTGTLLALNFAPMPGDAYRSVVYIIQSVAAGRMVRGLHHWGSSLMIIVVFLHMAQVFVCGAYRKPREATWMVGVCLMLFTLAFGLTGYLLPWDNRAYWGTMVTTQIVGSLPVMGSYLSRLGGFSNGIGVLTFSRFYAIHTLLLPATTVFLILIHVALVRRHGVTPRSSSTSERQTFYPKQAMRDVVAVFLAFLILFVAAATLEVPLDRIADPTDTTYIPRPEWYFLFLFQLLKWLQGPLEIFGTAVLPSLAVFFLFLTPFVQSRRLKVLHRPALPVVIVLLVFAAWTGLTAAALLNSPEHNRPAFVPPEAATWAQLEPEQIAGVGYFHSSHCDSCHNLLSGTPKPGPNLASFQNQHPREWLVQHFTNPGNTGSEHENTATYLSVPQLNALSLFIQNRNPDSTNTLESMSPKFIRGAQVYVTGACSSCHKVNGVGGGLGPSLNGLANRRNRRWVEEHFLNPPRLSPGSNMPAYHFSPEEQEAIVLYLFSLPD
jgi:ubiquinol-cytochrome c reductase cytochrome b subunit